jgi:glycosyltransferase involved in cell wall biosynthesis
MMESTPTLNQPTSPAVPPRVATQRVLHVINGEHYSGAERVQDLLAQELPELGYEVVFACVKPDCFPDARQTKTATLYRTPMRGRFDLSCGRRLAQLIRQEDLALVHAHTPRSLLAGAIAARLADVPLVYHVHSPTARDSTRRLHNWVNARLERLLLRQASRLIAVSPSLRDLMIREGFSPDRVVYVANGVPGTQVVERKKPTGTWTLGMAALFRPRKGIEVLLAALAELRTAGHDVRLRAIGPFETPEYHQEVLTLVERLGVGGAIDWTGFVGDIHTELRQVDLFVLPSLFGEGLPMVVLEALAAGLPVVASDVEGIPVAIRSGNEGLLVDANNPAMLALAIEQIIAPDSTHDYLRLSANARQRHADHFSATAMATGVAEVYRGVVG